MKTRRNLKFEVGKLVGGGFACVKAHASFFFMKSNCRYLPQIFPVVLLTCSGKVITFESLLPNGSIFAGQRRQDRRNGSRACETSGPFTCKRVIR